MSLLFDLTGWTVLKLEGRDCVSFLNNFCTNDLKKLPAGAGFEAFVTNIKARVVAHTLIARPPEPLVGLMLLTAPGQGESLAAHLDRYVIREDVTIRDVTAEAGLLCLIGTQAAAVLVSAGIELPEEAATPGQFSVSVSLTDDVRITVLWTNLFGQPGCFLEGPRDHLVALRERLVAAGATPASAEHFEALRIEAVFPLSGIDVTDEHLAPEADRPQAISYTKGCYLGQEPIARIDALGHVNRLLRGIRLEPGHVPVRGATILAEGKEIGTITSVAIAPSDNRPVALACVRTKFATPGTTVSVQTPEGERPAVVYGPAR